MIFKLMEAAEGGWRKLTGAHLVALVRAGTEFVNGELVRKPGEGRRVITDRSTTFDNRNWPASASRSWSWPRPWATSRKPAGSAAFPIPKVLRV